MSLQSSEVTHKTNAFITGIFYMLAAATSIVAGILYDPLLHNPDYLLLGAAKSHQVGLAAIVDCFSVVTVAGTGIMLFPYLRKFNESLALGYFSFRILEAISILVSIVSVLSLLTLSKNYANAVQPDLAAYNTTGVSLRAIHDWAYIVGPNFLLGINTFIYSLIFHQSELVPRKLSSLGLFAAVLIFIASLLEIFGIIKQVSVAGFLFALPIFLYEMILAVWLIAKGFNSKSFLLIKVKA